MAFDGIFGMTCWRGALCAAGLDDADVTDAAFCDSFIA
jgi:hypothetical protein